MAILAQSAVLSSGLEISQAQLRGHVPKDRSLIQQVAPLQSRIEAIKACELHDPDNDAELHFFLQELRLKLFVEPIAQQKRPQPPFPARVESVAEAS